MKRRAAEVENYGSPYRECFGERPRGFWSTLRASFRQNLPPEERRFAKKRKRFSMEQIVAVLKQGEVGVPVAELTRRVGISE